MVDDISTLAALLAVCISCIAIFVACAVWQSKANSAAEADVISNPGAVKWEPVDPNEVATFLESIGVKSSPRRPSILGRLSGQSIYVGFQRVGRSDAAYAHIPVCTDSVRDRLNHLIFSESANASDPPPSTCVLTCCGYREHQLATKCLESAVLLKHTQPTESLHSSRGSSSSNVVTHAIVVKEHVVICSIPNISRSEFKCFVSDVMRIVEYLYGIDQPSDSGM
jgi:hypothetical protein